MSFHLINSRRTLQELYVYLNDDKSFDYAMIAYVSSLVGLKYLLNMY